MNPLKLIGLPYRLGACPEKHGAADCLSLSRTILAWYGIDTPDPERSWYRRLKREDYSVFEEQLLLWGDETELLKVGTVGLCKAPNQGLGLATYFEELPGWISFVGSAVRWSPIGALEIVKYYCPTKSSYVKH